MSSSTDKAYDFFIAHEGKSFVLQDLCVVTGWKPSTARTYIAKKWKDFLQKTESGEYVVDGFVKISKEGFIARQSQITQQTPQFAGKAFTIMQIGHAELDKLYDTCIFQVLKDCQLESNRVDRDNGGGLLKHEIIKFIESADIIVADLTNERPNCYLEIGYVMGVGKYSNLILTAREDHYPSSPNYNKNGPKIHFDLTGYEIIFWDPKNLEKFKDDLQIKVKRRLTTVRQTKGIETPIDIEPKELLPANVQLYKNNYEKVSDARNLVLRDGAVSAQALELFWKARDEARLHLDDKIAKYTEVLLLKANRAFALKQGLEGVPIGKKRNAIVNEVYGIIRELAKETPHKEYRPFTTV